MQHEHVSKNSSRHHLVNSRQLQSNTNASADTQQRTLKISEPTKQLFEFYRLVKKSFLSRSCPCMPCRRRMMQECLLNEQQAFNCGCRSQHVFPTWGLPLRAKWLPCAENAKTMGNLGWGVRHRAAGRGPKAQIWPHRYSASGAKPKAASPNVMNTLTLAKISQSLGLYVTASMPRGARPRGGGINDRSDCMTLRPDLLCHLFLSPAKVLPHLCQFNPSTCLNFS